MLENCLSSIYGKITGIKFEVIVVDNASTDGSVEMVISRKYEHLHMICNKDNKGFVRANNQGAKYARGRYLLLLNSDTEVVDGQINVLVSYMDQNAEVGIAAGMLLNTDHTFQRPFRRFPTIVDSLIQNTIGIIKDIWYPGKYLFHQSHLDKFSMHEVDWLTGAYLFIRKNALECSKVFDEDIFMYYEDTLLCYEIKKKGFRVVYLPFAPVVHHKGKSSEKISALGVLRSVNANIIYHKKTMQPAFTIFYKRMILMSWLCIYGMLYLCAQITSCKKIVKKRDLFSVLLKNKNVI